MALLQSEFCETKMFDGLFIWFSIEESASMTTLAGFHSSVAETFGVGLLISETIHKNFQNHLYGQPVLTFDKRQMCEEISKELRFNVIKNLLSLFFIHGFITMCNLKKRLIRSAF